MAVRWLFLRGVEVCRETVYGELHEECPVLPRPVAEQNEGGKWGLRGVEVLQKKSCHLLHAASTPAPIGAKTSIAENETAATGFMSNKKIEFEKQN